MSFPSGKTSSSEIMSKEKTFTKKNYKKNNYKKNVKVKKHSPIKVEIPQYSEENKQKNIPEENDSKINHNQSQKEKFADFIIVDKKVEIKCPTVGPTTDKKQDFSPDTSKIKPKTSFEMYNIKPIDNKKSMDFPVFNSPKVQFEYTKTQKKDDVFKTMETKVPSQNPSKVEVPEKKLSTAFPPLLIQHNKKPEPKMIFPDVKPSTVKVEIPNEEITFSAGSKRTKRNLLFSFNETGIEKLPEQSNFLDESKINCSQFPSNQIMVPVNYIQEKIILNSEGLLNPRVELERQYKQLETLKTLRERFDVCEIPGQGNCLFESVLRCYGLSEHLHLRLRSAVCASLRKNETSDTLSSYLALQNTSKEAYVNKMEREGEWGTDIEVREMAYMLNCQFVVIRVLKNGKINSVMIYGPEENTTHLAFLMFQTHSNMEAYEGCNHYTGLIPCDSGEFLDYDAYMDASRKLRLQVDGEFYLSINRSDEYAQEYKDNLSLEQNLKKNQPRKGKYKKLYPVKSIPENSLEDSMDEIHIPSAEKVHKVKEKHAKRKKSAGVFGGLKGYLFGDKVEKNYEYKSKKDLNLYKQMDLHNFKSKVNFFENIEMVVPVKTAKHHKESYFKIGIYNEFLESKKRFENVSQGTKFCEIASILKNSKEKVSVLFDKVGRNVYFERDYMINTFHDEYQIPETILRGFPFAICSQCSGLNEDGYEVLRVFNSWYEFKEHCNRPKHGGFFPKKSLIAFDSEGWSFIQAQGISIYHLMREKPFAAGANPKPIQKQPQLKNKLNVVGWNSVSLASDHNHYLMKNYLNEKKPHFVLLNECGDMSKRRWSDMTDYGFYHNGTEVGFIYSKQFMVHKMIDEYNDNYNLVCKVNCNYKEEEKAIIMYSCYIPPHSDHAAKVRQLVDRLIMLRERYSKFSLILYGDLNMDRKNFQEKIMDRISPLGYKGHFHTGNMAYTRRQKKGETTEFSYLDYFITFNIPDAVFNISEPIGRSDHLTLNLAVETEKALNHLCIRKVMGMDFGAPKREKNIIFDIFIRVLDGQMNLEEFLLLLKNRYKPRVKKFKNFFTPCKKANEYLEHRKEENFDFDHFRNIVRAFNKEEFEKFMTFFKHNRAGEEYFRRFRCYSNIGDKIAPLKNLQLEDGTVTVDPHVINKLVTDFYKKLFQDNDGVKNRYPITQDGIMLLNAGLVETALDNVKLDKAVSWDLIPGEMFQLVKETEKTNRPLFVHLCGLIANLINSILNQEIIDNDIFVSRLFCLNKNGDQNGKVDNIRPIAIASTLVKIYESALKDKIMEHVESADVICKKQIGFMKGCGCDLNLLKLRVRTQQLKDHQKKGSLSANNILFIDFKAAYDMVNHEILFTKMQQKGFSPEVINSVKRLFSNYKTKTDYFSDPININRGVPQGSLISPILFNVFIDDLLRQLGVTSFEVLAYADDVAVISVNDRQLKQACDIIEAWSKLNLMKINYHKSGIMYLYSNSNNLPATRYDFPVVKFYKFLGVWINIHMNCAKQIDHINQTLEVYLQRNGLLMFKYFSPRSLMKINHYFHASRLMYGMLAFLDIDSCIEDLNKKVMKYMSTVLSSPKGTNNARIRASLAVAQTKHKLAIRLLKALFKYERVWGIRVTRYDDAIVGLMDQTHGTSFRNIASFLTLSQNDFRDYTENILNSSLEQDFRAIGVTANPLFRKVITEIYDTYDRRYIFMLKYFTNSAYYKERYHVNCKNCSEFLCSREHVTDTCKHFTIQRDTVKKALVQLGVMTNQELLSDAFNRLYFQPVDDKRKRQQVYRTMGTFMTSLIVDSIQGDVNNAN